MKNIEMQDINIDELTEIEGGSCVGALGVVVGLTLAAPFTEGISLVAAWYVIGGMAAAGCK
jgi:hypothetical protein